MSEYLETVSPKSLCDLASIVLKGNYFELSNIIYHQKLGTAIGTKFACQPFYGRSRESFIWKFRVSPISLAKIFWWHICIWIDGLEKLQEFFKFLNAFHPTIKFTMDYSYEVINVLDVQVSKKNSTLETDLYCKDTDRHQYLHAKSCHRYVYKSIYHLTKQYG